MISFRKAQSAIDKRRMKNAEAKQLKYAKAKYKREEESKKLAEKTEHLKAKAQYAAAKASVREQERRARHAHILVHPFKKKRGGRSGSFGRLRLW